MMQRRLWPEDAPGGNDRARRHQSQQEKKQEGEPPIHAVTSYRRHSPTTKTRRPPLKGVRVA
jgi:hypothetical protein